MLTLRQCIPVVQTVRPAGRRSSVLGQGQELTKSKAVRLSPLCSLRRGTIISIKPQGLRSRHDHVAESLGRCEKGRSHISPSCLSFVGRCYSSLGSIFYVDPHQLHIKNATRYARMRARGLAACRHKLICRPLTLPTPCVRYNVTACRTKCIRAVSSIAADYL